jgi:haloacetate dehalogenase
MPTLRRSAIRITCTRADRRHGRRIACPVLVLWSAWGSLNTWYTDAGGPLAIWRAWADDVRGGPLEAGHFFPEEIPDVTVDALNRFFGPETTTG